MAGKIHPSLRQPQLIEYVLFSLSMVAFAPWLFPMLVIVLLIGALRTGHAADSLRVRGSDAEVAIWNGVQSWQHYRQATKFNSACLVGCDFRPPFLLSIRNRLLVALLGISGFFVLSVSFFLTFGKSEAKIFTYLFDTSVAFGLVPTFLVAYQYAVGRQRSLVLRGVDLSGMDLTGCRIGPTPRLDPFGRLVLIMFLIPYGLQLGFAAIDTFFSHTRYGRITEQITSMVSTAAAARFANGNHATFVDRFNWVMGVMGYIWVSLSRDLSVVFALMLIAEYLVISIFMRLLRPTTILDESNLMGSCLRGVSFDAITVRGLRFNAATYYKSGWTARFVQELVLRGADPGDTSEYGSDVFDIQPGLLLTLHKPMGWYSRLVVDSLLVAILGKDTDCRVVEYKEHDRTVSIRLEGSRREDLEATGEALYHRIWELQQQEHEAELGRLTRRLTASQTVVNYAPIGVQTNVQGDLQVVQAVDPAVVTRLQKLQDALGANLSDLVDRLERMELRLPDEDAATMLNDQAATRKALKLVRTWTPSDHPRTALDRLLASFDPDEVRLLAAQGPEGAEVVANLPAGPATPAHVGAEMVAELLRRGLVDEAFFARLEAAHPDRAEEVRRVAGLWKEQEDEG